MTTQDDDDCYRIDPDKLLKQIEIELRPETLQQLNDLVAASGRSIDEFILEILEKSLKDRRTPEKPDRQANASLHDEGND